MQLSISSICIWWDQSSRGYETTDTEGKIWTGYDNYSRRDGNQIPTNTCQDRYSEASLIADIA